MMVVSTRKTVVVLATLVTALITASLGVWQLSRAAEKLELEQMIDTRAALRPWDESELAIAGDASLGYHRPVRLTGEWLPSASVFLDNRPMNGHSGFILVTPLLLKGQTQAILVQRGWVARDFTDRTRLPDIATQTGLVTVEGRLAPPPSQLFELGSTQSGSIRQNIDLTTFAQETGLVLLNGSVLQMGPKEDLFQRDWPRFAAGVQKHYGYAFQWFALSATTVALFLWFQIISPRRKLRPHGSETQ